MMLNLQLKVSSNNIQKLFIPLFETKYDFKFVFNLLLIKLVNTYILNVVFCKLKFAVLTLHCFKLGG